MPELIARGFEPQQEWRVPLLPGRVYVIGRDPDLALSVPWDAFVSRRHVELEWRNAELHLHRLGEAENPVFHAGEPVDRCRLLPGQHFVIGRTCFLLQDEGGSSGDRPVEELTFSRQALHGVQFRDPDRRIEVLAHLPDVIWGARSDSELHVRLVRLLLAGIPHAEAAAVVSQQGEELRTFHWERRHETDGAFRPSARLVREALRSRREIVLHVWEAAPQSADFTAVGGFDWAFCAPIVEPLAEPWGLYVTGRFDPQGEINRSDPSRLQPDVKFAELVAEIVGSLRRLNQLERQQATLRQFFPPVILPALTGGREEELLAPREAEITVMFCDLRGFSRHAEVSRGDPQGLLGRVSQALGVMTHNILEHGGVIGDFQGDSVMGFWGWPVPSPDASLNACRAALAINRVFRQTRAADHPLSTFDAGIGLAHGRAVAGKIGTREHVKVTVFGLAVNLASRLEGMTRHLRAPILMDRSLSQIARERLPLTEGRVRRLARVLPYGMETPLLVSELVPPLSEAPHLSDQHLTTYESAVDAFLEGKWDDAYHQLRQLPAEDRAQDFLTAYILQNNRQPPAGWTGTVALPGK